MKIKLLLAGVLAGVLSLGFGTDASAQRHPRPGVVVVTPPVPPPPVVVVTPARPHRGYYAGHYRHHRKWDRHHHPYRHHGRGHYRHGRW